MSKVIAYLGPPGTFTQAALINHFGAECEQRSCGSIDEVFSVTESDGADVCVVPIENSTEGIVNNTQDCLVDTSLNIVGEEVVDIAHNLLVASDDVAFEIQAIASHKQSLAQCRQWIQAYYPDAELIECESNADAAQQVSSEKGIAAIAGNIAADLYGLTVAAKGIQDKDHNRTRFLVLSKESTAATGHDKTSILVYTENKPGALFRALEPFENLQVSLTKIDSRPSKKEAWEYVFFIDFEGHKDDSTVNELFSRLEERTQHVKVLGSYTISGAKP